MSTLDETFYTRLSRELSSFFSRWFLFVPLMMFWTNMSLHPLLSQVPCYSERAWYSCLRTLCILQQFKKTLNARKWIMRGIDSAQPPDNTHLFTKSTVILKNKTQLDVTYYFIVLLMGSTCFGHYYAHHQELATIMLITTLVVSFLVCCRWPIIISGRDTCPVCASDHKRIAPPVDGSFLQGHSGRYLRLTAHKYHFPSQQCVALYL